MVAKRFYTSSICRFHKEFSDRNPLIGISLSTFYKLKPREIRRLKLTKRQTCLCMYHTNARLHLKACARHARLFMSTPIAPSHTTDSDDADLEEAPTESVSSESLSDDSGDWGSGSRFFCILCIADLTRFYCALVSLQVVCILVGTSFCIRSISAWPLQTLHTFWACAYVHMNTARACATRAATGRVYRVSKDVHERLKALVAQG